MNRLSLSALLLMSAAPTMAADPVFRTAKSGPWSEASTWEGKAVPGEGAKVLVRSGHAVVYDVAGQHVIRGLNVAGHLSFAPDRDTLLNVGLIKIQPGDEYSEEGFDCDAHEPGNAATHAGQPVFEIGTPDKPIAAGKTATIRLHYIEGMNKDSCPAIVACGGRWDSHGQPLNRSWVKLGATTNRDTASVQLAEAVTGWRVGDRVIVTATGLHGSRDKGAFTEERTIKAIEGMTLTLDRALERVHQGEGEFRGEVANLSRNVVIESATPEGVRGHTMYHRGSAGSLAYTEFRHLGKKGVLGRYSLHFHLCGDTMRGSSVVGNSIWASQNRWLTIHGTNYLVARDNVGYKSLGHGFFLEDGTEVYNVIDRNLAVGAEPTKKLPKQLLPFDQNNGAGFWWTNSLNTFTRNVAVENGQYGFRYEATPSSALKLDFPILQPDGTRKTVDVRTLPFVRFEDNEVHSNIGLYGVNLGEGVNRVGPDARHPFVVRNLKIWDTHYGFRPQVPSLLVENLTLHHVAYGVYHPNFDNHVYRNVTVSQTNTEPFNRGHDDDSVQYGGLTVDGLTLDGCRSGGMPLIQISDHNPTGTAETHMRNVKVLNWTNLGKTSAIVNLGGGPRPEPTSPKGVPVYLHDWFGQGRTAMVVSMKSGEYKQAPEKYREETPLTGNESRVVEVKDMAFPKLLDPVDDLPPTTVITRVIQGARGIVVLGTSADNGTIRSVKVNGQEATSVTPNFAEWRVELPLGETLLKAYAEDAAGNVEKIGHKVGVATHR